MAEGNDRIILDVLGNTKPIEKEIQRVANQALTLNTKGFSQPLGKINGQLGEFEKSLAASNARVIAFGASAGAIYAVQKAFETMIGNTVQLEKSLKDINVILNVSDKQLSSFGDGLFSIAQSTAQSFSEVAKAATELSRQGLSVEETLKRTSDALILSRLSGLDTAKSVEAITAALNSFNKTTLDSNQLINKFAAVDAAFAVSSADLAEAVKRVGSTAQDAGVSIDELISLVTSAQQITSRGGSVIGNSFKTIFTRVQRPQVLEGLEAIGVATKTAEGGTRPLIQILSQLASTYDTLSDSQQSQVAELVGGVYQINILKAAISDLSKEYSIFGRALNISSQAANQANLRNEELNTTISALFNKTLVNLNKSGAQFGEKAFAPVIKNLLTFINSGLEGFQEGESEGVGTKIGKAISTGLGNFLSGPGLVLGTLGLVKIFERLITYSADAFKSLSGINAKNAEQQSLQTQILNLIGKNPQIIQQINSGTSNTANLHKQILTLIEQETVAMQKQLSVAAQLSKSLIRSGVSVPTSGPMRGTAVKTSALGYIPNFSEREKEEIFGAAMGGYKAGKVKNMNIPGEGNVLYNTAESIVRFDKASQPAIMPPQQSRAGENYKKNFEKTHGFDPYSVFSKNNFIPNFNRSQYQDGWVMSTGKIKDKLKPGSSGRSFEDDIRDDLDIDYSDNKVWYRSRRGDNLALTNKLQNAIQGKEEASALKKGQKDGYYLHMKRGSKGAKDISKYVMVYPGFGKSKGGTTYGQADKYEGNPSIGFQTFPFPGQSKPNIGEDLVSTARKQIVDLSKEFISLIDDRVNPKIVKDKNFESAVLSNMDSSSINSFIGSAFEAGLLASVGAYPENRTENFDLTALELKAIAGTFLNANELLNYEEGDLKNSLSKENLNSMANKIANRHPNRYQKKISNTSTKTPSLAGTAFNGFIPNFSSIKKAMDREKIAEPTAQPEVLWSDTLGSLVVANNKQTAKYGKNADRIIKNDHIDQGQVASKANLMKTGSGKEKYTPNFASSTDFDFSIGGFEDKGVSASLLPQIERLKKASDELVKIYEKEARTLTPNDQILKDIINNNKLNKKSTEQLYQLNKEIIRAKQTEASDNKINPASSLRQKIQANPIYQKIEGARRNLFDDDALSQSQRQFKDKLFYASIGLSLLGGAASSLAEDNQKLGDAINSATIGMSTAAQVGNLIGGKAGLYTAAIGTAISSLVSISNYISNQKDKFDKLVQERTQRASDFGGAFPKYSEALQKFNDASTDPKTSSETLQNLQEKMYSAAQGLPDAYRSQLLAINSFTALQEKGVEIQEKLNKEKDNADFASRMQGRVDSNAEAFKNVLAALTPLTKSPTFKSSEATQYGQKMAGDLSLDQRKNFESIISNIANKASTQGSTRSARDILTEQLTQNPTFLKTYGVNQELTEPIENLAFKANALGVGDEESVRKVIRSFIDSILEGQKDLQTAKNLEKEREKQISVLLKAEEATKRATEQTNLFREALNRTTENAVLNSSFDQQYQNQTEYNKYDLAIKKSKMNLDYNQPFLSEESIAQQNFSLGEKERQANLLFNSKKLETEAVKSMVSQVLKNVDKIKQSGDEVQGTQDLERISQFKNSILELQKSNLNPKQFQESLLQQFSKTFGKDEQGNLADLMSSSDATLQQMVSEIKSLHQTTNQEKALAQAQLEIQKKMAQRDRDIKAFGGIDGGIQPMGAYSQLIDEFMNFSRAAGDSYAPQSIRDQGTLGSIKSAQELLGGAGIFTNDRGLRQLAINARSRQINSDARALAASAPPELARYFFEAQARSKDIATQQVDNMMKNFEADENGDSNIDINEIRNALDELDLSSLNSRLGNNTISTDENTDAIKKLTASIEASKIKEKEAKREQEGIEKITGIDYQIKALEEKKRAYETDPTIDKTIKESKSQELLNQIRELQERKADLETQYGIPTPTSYAQSASIPQALQQSAPPKTTTSNNTALNQGVASAQEESSEQVMINGKPIPRSQWNTAFKDDTRPDWTTAKDTLSKEYPLPLNLGEEARQEEKRRTENERRKQELFNSMNGFNRSSLDYESWKNQSQPFESKPFYENDDKNRKKYIQPFESKSGGQSSSQDLNLNVNQDPMEVRMGSMDVNVRAEPWKVELDSGTLDNISEELLSKVEQRVTKTEEALTQKLEDLKRDANEKFRSLGIASPPSKGKFA
jgi:TP901 family phage tail tape measure protein